MNAISQLVPRSILTFPNEETTDCQSWVATCLEQRELVLAMRTAMRMETPSRWVWLPLEAIPQWSRSASQRSGK